MRHKFSLILLASAFSVSLISAAVVERKPVELTDAQAKYTAKSNLQAVSGIVQRVNVGFANTSGNTETMNLNGKYDMLYSTTGYAGQALNTAFDAGLYVTKNNSIKDNEEYTANLVAEQFIADGWFGYGAINWLSNEFKNYDNKLSFGVGVGKEVFNDGTQSLKLRFGPSYNIEDFSNAEESREFASVNEYLEYKNQLNTISNLYVKLGAMQNLEDFSDDYEFVAIGGVSFAVAESLSLSLEAELSYDKRPALGFDDTDTKTIVRLGYSF